MKRHILYLAMLALGTAATGCSDDDTAKEGRTEPTTVESISIRTQMAEVSRAQTGDDDPTMGPASTRAGHTMTVTLGSGSERMQATYEYDGGKWIPAGEAVVFPDNKRQPVGIILRKEGTAIQDGTAQGLIDADQLGWDNPAQVPLREMANVPMRHLKTMVEFELGTIAATALTVDGLKACHVGNGNKWQAIIEPSTPGFRVSVTVNNTVSTTEVSAAASPCRAWRSCASACCSRSSYAWLEAAGVTLLARAAALFSGMSLARTGCASSSATASSESCLFIIFPFIQIITLPVPDASAAV